jgi:tetratricopeptide (TPR) repeat protein
MSEARLKRDLLILFAIMISLPVFSQNAEFDAANKLYYEGRFSDSASIYQKLAAQSPHSSVLFFNLGNAFFKSGQFGRAISCYRRAESLTPRDPDVRANLRFARGQVQGATLKPDRLLAWLSQLTLNEWAVAASFCLWIVFLLLAVMQARPQLQRPLRPFVLVAGLVLAFLVVCTVFAWHELRGTTIVVVSVPEMNIRNGPFDSAKSVVVVHDGAELRVLDHKSDWLQVTPDQQRIGWIPRSAVTVL